jgi:hypothetical protein
MVSLYVSLIFALYLKYRSTLVLLKFLGQLGKTLNGLVSLSSSINWFEKFALLPSWITTPSFSVGTTGLLYPTSRLEAMFVKCKSASAWCHSLYLNRLFKFFNGKQHTLFREAYLKNVIF